MNKKCAYITEVFSSIQGEGLLCGERHIFVRFAGCGLGCRYCDTPDAFGKPGNCAVERRGGSGIFRNEPNPVGVEALAGMVQDLNTPQGLHHALALTGGEPLEQGDFLVEFIPAVKPNRMRILLETNGTLPDCLERIIDLVDIISADFKIESSTGLPPKYDESRRFLEIALRKPTYIKIVVTSETTTAEIEDAAGIIASVNPAIPVILQPVTPPEKQIPQPVSRILVLQEAAGRHLAAVRVIPQMHNILGLK